MSPTTTERRRAHSRSSGTPTADTVWAALAKRYPPPAWALLAQVGNGTGFTGNRYADAMAMSLWPSRGLHLHGFEIKVYRTDWLRELKDPAKAEDVAAYCNFWWVATAPDVIRPGELPATWGHLVLNGKRGLVMEQIATENHGAALDLPMVAAILRRASDGMVPRQSVNGLVSAAREEGVAHGKTLVEREIGIEAVERKYNTLRKAVDLFQEASGVQIGSEWNAGDVGRRFARAAVLNEVEQGYNLQHVESALASALNNVRAAKQAASPSIPKGTET
jgi:hypothetical protein